MMSYVDKSLDEYLRDFYEFKKKLLESTKWILSNFKTEIHAFWNYGMKVSRRQLYCCYRQTHAIDNESSAGRCNNATVAATLTVSKPARHELQHFVDQYDRKRQL